AAASTGAGELVSVLAVVNATGDVLGAGGELIAGPRGEDGVMLRSVEMFAAGLEPPVPPPERQSTTLACVMTDAGLDKLACAKVARMASAGVARAVDPVFTPFDGDVVFCLSDGVPREDPWQLIRLGSLAAALVAAAIRDGVERAQDA
ncbi:MAG: P1 family peptidase, partial [Solirubrobacterales bacterium]|nr:P1 family peptidase [Solirubrobacterales bacterium]